MGSIYKRGDTYWIQYYHRGKRYRESTESSSKMVANHLLKQREGEIASGKIPALVYDKTRFSDLEKLIKDDYRLHGKKSQDRVKHSLKHLAYFNGYRATEITSSAVDQYILTRVSEGAANATINRELSCLKRMLNLGAKAGKVGTVPKITLLAENNTRKGFFERHEYEALLKELPDYLRPFITFLYKSGWRVGETKSLQWSQVDRNEWCVRIEGEQTKNKQARTFYLDSELKSIFQRLWEQYKGLRKVPPYVFLGRGSKGPIKDLRHAWDAACERAGVQRTPHDFRRTATRNFVRAKVPDVVAMQITGHKTRSVFDRYNIVSDDDLRNASKSLEDHQAISEDSHNLATIKQLKKKTG